MTKLNIHNVYGNHLVYDGNLAYTAIKNENTSIKLLTSYSTAFIAPSLYQLYDGFAGNIDLNPESNETFEVGFEASFQDDMVVIQLKWSSHLTIQMIVEQK